MKTQKYYIDSGITASAKKIMIFVVVLLAIIPTYKLIIGDFRIVHSFFYIVSFILLLIVLNKVKILGIELSERGLRTNFLIVLRNNILFSRYVPCSLKWEEIQGMMISYSHIYSYQKKEVAKIYFKKPGQNLKYLLLEPTSFANASEFLSNLKEKIPNTLNSNKIFSEVLQVPAIESEITYKNWSLSQEGIVHLTELIRWDLIKEIKYDDLNRSIKGYGSIDIAYLDSKNEIENLQILSDGTDQFRNFLIYLIKNSSKASIDPAILKLFDDSYKIERRFISVFILSVIIILILLIGYYIYEFFL